MSLKVELTIWSAGLKAYDQGELDHALDEFAKIADTSKICWNMGIILATLGQHDEAVEQFNIAVSMDKFMAVGWFQKGVSHFMVKRYDEAHQAFEEALLYMRGNQTINYEQLGLDFRLYAAEILFNCGLAKLYLGQIDTGLRDLGEAQAQKVIPEHDVIDDAIRDRGVDYTVFSVPVGILFQPSQAKLKNLEARDYMGKAILVAATDTNEAYTTFSGITRLQRGLNPRGAPLDAGHPLSRSASVSTIPQPVGSSPLLGLSRNNTIASTRPTAFPRDSLGLVRRSSGDTPDNLPSKLPLTGAVSPLNLPGKPPRPRTNIEIGSPSSDPQIRTPQDRLKSLAVTELYDYYYKEYAAYDDEPMPDLPPIKGPNSKIEMWARKTPSGAPPRRPSVTSNGGMWPGRVPGLSRNGSMARSRYEDESTREAGGVTDMAKIRVKVHVGKHTRGMSIVPTQNYDDFTTSLRDKFPELGSQLLVRFKDEDGDMLSLVDEGDFEAAVDVARVMSGGKAEGKLEIWVE
ncbi:hypothetical protein BCR39DRAFT_484589 [Naematelia encephala]|uniref:PB1 domain-containing protein n=1 Tax=Naematelia encephala TaxID=71784 RepID=A0A1Y2AUU6_9TREE|nr:hypothetical protein BCR39DRAFT_484589 [Naematelia encephala]